MNKIEIQLKRRLEQRFLGDSLANFALRARGFVAVQIPIVANESFPSGLFAGLQNELF